MKLTGFETQIVELPRESGPLGASAMFVTLKLRTDDGIEGIGYAGFTSALMMKALRETLDALTGQAIGSDPMMIEAIGARLLSMGGGGSPSGLVTRAVSAIDVALWDIRGKALGQPVYRLLGGFADRVPAYASGHLWRTYDLDMLAKTGPEIVESGFRAMKFRMGGEDSDAKEIERMRVMREAIGDDIDLMVDINQGWDINTTLRIGRLMADYNLYWLEDPTHYQDYVGYARIADALDTPIATGEYHYGTIPFRHMLENRSLDIVMVDLLRVGGLTGFMKVAHMAEIYNLPVVSHLATEVLAHAIAAAPNGIYVEHMPWTFDLFTTEPVIEEGMIVLPQTPGLGVEFDEDKLSMYAVG